MSFTLCWLARRFRRRQARSTSPCTSTSRIAPTFSATGATTEREVVAGSAAITLHVTNDRFAGDFTSTTDVAAILRSISSHADSDGAWTDAVAALADEELGGSAMSASLGTTLVIQPDALAAFHITDPEALDITVPSFVTNGGVATYVENVTTIADTNEVVFINTIIVDEDGGTDTFAIRLAAEPSADATVSLIVDANELELSASQVTFSTANWNSARVVTATAVDNDAGDGVHRVYISNSVSSSDAEFVTSPPKAVTVNDDDVGFVSTALSPATISEGDGSQATFSMRLATDIAGSVTVTVVGSDQYTVAPTTLTFSSASALVPQTATVVAVDDDAGEGLTVEAISFTVQTLDDAYNDASAPATVALTIRDDDIGAVVGHGDAVLDEGERTTISLALVGSPATDVSIAIVGDDGGAEAAITPFDVLTFSTANWAIAQTVLVTTLLDEKAEWPGEITFDFAMMSNDTRFNGFPIDAFVVTTLDILPELSVVRPFEETVGNSTVAGTALWNETGFHANLVEGAVDSPLSYVVSLTGPPVSEFVVDIETSPSDLVAVEPSDLTFANANWNVSQTVFVRPVDDALPENNVDVTVQFALDTSADRRFDDVARTEMLRLSAESSVSVIDDDVLELGDLRFRTRPLSNVTMEGGPDLSFVVEFVTRPTFADPIGLSASTSDDLAVSVSPAVVTWLEADWNDGTEFVVSSVNNLRAEGTQNYTLSFCMHNLATDGSLLDATSCLVAPMRDVDDDVAGVHVEEPDGSTSEDGSTVSFPVVLETEPLGPVVLAVSVDDASEAALVSTGTLTFPRRIGTLRRLSPSAASTTMKSMASQPSLSRSK